MDRRVTRTKELIQKAYLELLMEKKTGKITISEISRRANIDRKTFYLHYESVDDIVHEFCAAKVRELVDSIKMEEFPNESFSVTRMFGALDRMVEENMALFRFLSANRKYDFFFDQLKETVVSIIVRNGQEYFGYSERDLSVYSEFYISGIISVYVRWLREGTKYPVNELSALVSDACYGGLEGLLADRSV